MVLKRTLIAVVAGVCLLASAGPGSAAEKVTAESLFERAETLYRQLDVADPAVSDSRSWETLAEVFATIPERFPTHPLAGDALWRLSDIRARESRAGQRAASPQAIATLELLITRYPTSRFAPAAYLRLAELGSPGEAPTQYYRLLQRYPGSPEAEEARLRLTAAARADDSPGVEQRTPATGGQPAATTGAPGGLTSTELDPIPTTITVPDNAAAEPATASFGTDNAPTDEVLEASPTPASRTSSSAETPVAERNVPVTMAGASDWSRMDLGDGTPGSVLGVRHFSDDKVTRVVLDLDRPIRHEIGEANGPPRIFVDLIGARMRPDLPELEVIDGPGVQRVRFGLNRPGVVRVVLDLRQDTPYSFFTLNDPYRLVVDIPNGELSDRLASARRPPRPEGGAEARQLSLGIRKVMIDPGHGGTAPGAIGRSGVTEKELTLDIALRLARNLRASGYEVELTREDDRTLPLEARPQMATNAGADLFVSIHVNSSTNRSLSGFETYYLDLATDPTAAETAARENANAAGGLGNLDHLLDEIVKNANKRESRDLAHSIQDSLVLQTTRQHDDIRDLGVKHAPFVVLVGAQMPAVLVECSFLSHEGEERRLRDAEYRQRVADAIHIGIENFSAKRRMITSTH